MTASVDNIKNLLADSGLNNTGTTGNDLEELAREISESIEGLDDMAALSDTIYGNLVASGAGFRETDNLMGIAEKIATSVYTQSDTE